MGDWRAQAACKGLTTLMYPPRGEPVGGAIAICAGCTVRAECRAEGLHEVWGIWGGTTARERQRLRRDAASEMVGTLDPVGSKPTNEAQVRELTPLKGDPQAGREAA